MTENPAVTSAGDEPEAADRPVLLTVDDDPAVSRAVARDLRRQYGEHYRVVRASSGAEAMDVLRELKLRGARVAVLLADYRMPEMSGIEFLEQAMDLFPRARRALLTAYADTDAAIAAINVVDVDPKMPAQLPLNTLFPLIVTLVSVIEPSLRMPPPIPNPEFPLTVTLFSLALPEL